MKSNRIIQSAFLFVLSFSLLSMSNVESKLLDPVGEWIYEVSMPDGNSLSGEMKIAKVEGSYEVTIYSDVYGTMELDDVTMAESTLEANYEMEGDLIEFVMEFDGDEMEGLVYTPDGEIEMTAERK